MADNALSRLMRERNLTAANLSELSKVSKRTIEQYTSGRYDLGNARSHITIALADALGVHPRDLID